MKFDPSRRTFLKLLGLGAAAAATGIPLIGCDEEDKTQPAAERTAALLENYPEFLKDENGNIDYNLVIGNDQADFEAAYNIGTAIQTITGQIVGTKMPEETDLSQRLILVGRPAHLTYAGGDNPLLTDLVSTDPNAIPVLGFDEGLIKVYRQNDMNLLIVTGYGPDQVRNAGKVLSQADTYQSLENSEFFGKELLVKGSLDNYVLGKPQDNPQDQ